MNDLQQWERAASGALDGNGYVHLRGNMEPRFRDLFLHNIYEGFSDEERCLAFLFMAAIDDDSLDGDNRR